MNRKYFHIAVMGLIGLPTTWPLIVAAQTMVHPMEGASTAEVSGHGDSLEGLVAEALQNNPGIKAAGFQVKALHSSVDHAWYLDAPEIGVDFYQTPISSFPNPIKNQSEIDYSVRQALPFPGKIASRINAEHKHAEMGEADLVSRKRKVIRDVKTLYYELYLLDQKLKINQENQILMGRFLEIARRQYEVGLGKQSDILQAQTEATKIMSDSISLRQEREATESLLNAVLNRKTGKPLVVTSQLIPYQMEWTLEQIRPILEKSHPGLQGMKAGIRMREAEKTMAGKNLLPDFMIEGAFKDMLRMPPGTHGGLPENYWSVSASMNLPLALWSLPKYRAGTMQSSANLIEAEQEYIEAENMIFARAQGALSKAESNFDLLHLSQDVLLPQTEHALETNLVAYQGGKSEFMALIEAYRMRLMARQDSEMALMQLLSSQADLEEAVGLNLEQIADQLSKGDGK